MRPRGQAKLGFFPLPMKNGCLRRLAVRWRYSRSLIGGILRRTALIGGSVVPSAHYYSGTNQATPPIDTEPVSKLHTGENLPLRRDEGIEIR